MGSRVWKMKWFVNYYMTGDLLQRQLLMRIAATTPDQIYSCPRSTLEAERWRYLTVHKGDIMLVAIPELKRYGNSKGQNLDREEFVGDCEGEVFIVS